MPDGVQIAPDSKPKSITRNPNGSYTRHLQFPTVPATLDHPSVVSKDVTINASNQTWLRIFLPRKVLDASPAAKLPLVVYFHGGGFVFLSAASDICHVFCSNMAARLGAVVASVQYRLAPEHRLPAAYEDAVEALGFVRNSREKWLTDYADVSNCFLMGCSAGANIAYHAGARACDLVGDLDPVRIKGLVLHQPFFGGTVRTGSELRYVNDPVLSRSGIDLLWELSLPEGADQDHEYCNPTMGCNGDRIRVSGWRVLVSGGYKDPLVDRQVEFAGALKKAGVPTVAHFVEGGHGMEVIDPSKAEYFFAHFSDFITSTLAMS